MKKRLASEGSSVRTELSKNCSMNCTHRATGKAGKGRQVGRRNECGRFKSFLPSYLNTAAIPLAPPRAARPGLCKLAGKDAHRQEEAERGAHHPGQGRVQSRPSHSLPSNFPTLAAGRWRNERLTSE